MRAGAATGETEQRAAGIRIPMRCAEPGKCRDQIHIESVGDAGCECLDFAGALDDSESVAQPLHDRPRHEHAAFECVTSLLATPGDRAQQPIVRLHGPVTRIQQGKTSGAVSVLGHAGRKAGLSEQRRVLIAGDARNRQCVIVDVNERRVF